MAANEQDRTPNRTAGPGHGGEVLGLFIVQRMGGQGFGHAQDRRRQFRLERDQQAAGHLQACHRTADIFRMLFADYGMFPRPDLDQESRDIEILPVHLDMRKSMLKASVAILTCLLAVPAAQAAYSTNSGSATPADAEAVTGGTFLNVNNVPDTRNGLTISAVALGADVTNVRSPFGSVNWSLNDGSDGSRLVGGRGVEDNNQRLNPTSTPPGTTGTSYNPFSFTISGLVAGSLYDMKIVALGVRADTGGGQIPGVLDSNNPDFGIDDYDFSYGTSAGSLTIFPNVAAGTLIYEERSSTATLIGGVNYYSWKGAYACDIGNWTADGSGQITLFLGEGAVNTVLNGARTQFDGVAIAPVPEPTTLVLLGLGGLALLIRRRK